MRREGQDRQNRGLTGLEYLWVLVLLLAPLDSTLLLPYTVFGFSLSLFRICLVAAIILSLVAVLVSGRVRIPAGSRIIFILCLTWLGWNVISGFWAVNVSLWFRYIALAAMYSALVMVVPVLATSLTKYRFILRCILSLLLLAVVLGVLESVTGLRLPASRQLSFHNEITSFFLNPSHFAAAMVMFSPFALQYISRKRRSGITVITALVAILILGAYLVMHTGSRGAVLSFVVVLVFTAVFLSRYPFQLFRVLIFLLLSLCAFFIVVPVLPDIPSVISDKLSDMKSLFKFIVGSDRVILLRSGWSLWQESPLIGWGAGASELLLEGIDPLGGVYSLHAWVLELLVNTGLIGFTLFTIFYLLLLMQLLKAYQHSADPYCRFLASSLCTGLIVAIPLSFVISSLMTFPLFWIYMGLSLGFLRSTKCAFTRAKALYKPNSKCLHKTVLGGMAIKRDGAVLNKNVHWGRVVK